MWRFSEAKNLIDYLSRALELAADYVAVVEAMIKALLLLQPLASSSR